MVNLAPLHCCTCLHGNFADAARAMVTAGLKWAPETRPNVYIITIKTKPHAIATPTRVTWYLWSIIQDAHPTNIITKVPRSSAIV